jgi:DNA-directed RNA polymerase subunit RPC12/RpoP
MVNTKDPERTAEKRGIPDGKCPHCGVKLSAWEQVLLNVDRALMCKNCWYRIILEVDKNGEIESKTSEE